MNQWTVEYYSNDSSAWVECTRQVYGADVDYETAVYYCLDDAVKAMRSEAECDPDLPHRVVEIVRTTVALASQGEELVRC